MVCLETKTVLMHSHCITRFVFVYFRRLCAEYARYPVRATAIHETHIGTGAPLIARFQSLMMRSPCMRKTAPNRIFV